MNSFSASLAAQKDLYLEDKISYTMSQAHTEIIDMVIEGLQITIREETSLITEAPSYPFLIGRRYFELGDHPREDDLFLERSVRNYSRLTVRHSIEEVHCSFTLHQSGGETPFTFSEGPLSLWDELRSHVENRHDKTKTDHMIHTTVHGSELNFVWYEETKHYALVLADSYNNVLLQEFNVQSSLLLTEMFTRWLTDLETKLFYSK